MTEQTETKYSYWDDLFAAMRPKQWIKNLLVFTAIVFSGKLTDPMALAKSIEAFTAFCFLSSANYILNDLFDRNNDIHHPQKRNRPIAKGRIQTRTALFWWAALNVFSLAVMWILGPKAFNAALVFIGLGIAYTVFLKDIVIIDAFTIAAGLVIRTLAGAWVIDVPISSWLLICTMLLALFVGLTKRSLEIKLLADNAKCHRPALAHYNQYLLDQMSSVITSAIVITYTLYTLGWQGSTGGQGKGLFITVPIVLYVMFRYLYIVHQQEVKTTLEAALVADRPMMIAVGIYCVTVLVAMVV
jgi:4-hydroxybenzoate polyprenyltransferase